MSGRGDPEKGISGAQQYKLTKDIFAEHGINSTRVTHGGRHAGALEAESLGVPLDVIKKGGDWKDRLGRLETHYLGKLPSQFARGMAGFWDKPFRLPRNNVSPSLKLQKMVFPWIEDCYGTDNDPWQPQVYNEVLILPSVVFCGCLSGAEELFFKTQLFFVRKKGERGC